ncbi:hypothetical protein [Rhizobium rhizogenes]|uniref:hypothetical protein n=1 Tax=Rhizobium rhizogenes TaxID=359 RepID=UPI0022BCA3CD|nr:hypothetical protein [Rhizobium rhizogenes]MCZ7480531.1 hypothetical protein [Rhizobium rhizogenes]
MPKSIIPATAEGMPKSTAAISSASRSALDAFMSKVLEPVTDAELVDTQYNSLVRHTRSKAWNAAKRKTEYYDALTTAALHLELNKGKEPNGLAVALPCRESLVDLYRQALADQLLTPAFQKLDIEWKKRQLARLKRWVPVRPEDVAASIQADENFLARHPVKRERCG